MPAPSCGDTGSPGWKPSWDLAAGIWVWRRAWRSWQGGLREAALPHVCKRDGFVTWPFPLGFILSVSQPSFRSSWWEPAQFPLFSVIGTAAGMWGDVKSDAPLKRWDQLSFWAAPGALFARQTRRLWGGCCSFLCLGATGAPVAFSLAFCSLVNYGVCVLANSLQAPRGPGVSSSSGNLGLLSGSEDPGQKASCFSAGFETIRELCHSSNHGELVTQLDPTLTSSPEAQFWILFISDREQVTPQRRPLASFCSVILQDTGRFFSSWTNPIPLLIPLDQKMVWRLINTRNYSWVLVIEGQFSGTFSPRFLKFKNTHIEANH